MKLTAKQSIIATNGSLSIGLLLCLLAIFGFILSGCTRENVHGSGRVITEERATSAFENVIVEGPFDIDLVQGTAAPLHIRAEDNVMRFIESDVYNGTLRLRLRRGINLKSFRAIGVKVTSEQYRKITFSGAGSVTAADTIHSAGFSFELNGSGNSSLKVDAPAVQAWINGSGNLTLEGRSNTYEAEINGSGDIRAAALQTGQANVRINGSGEQSIWVTTRLDARITGSGNIRYKGAPGTINSSVTGSGKIIKL
ncbi:head GIN domain-containing protein [Chitinophaga lutea]